ncbi:MAG: glycine cleavage system protein H [Lactobacillus sp.]|nr:glycine cleavage system protein H [Lactobacillus sp.]
MAFKETKYFWQAQLEPNKIRLGLTPEAQDELGRVKFVELPMTGELALGDTLVAVEAEKAVLDLPTPVAGKVFAVHTAISDDPELMNSQNHQDNWIADVLVD